MFLGREEKVAEGGKVFPSAVGTGSTTTEGKDKVGASQSEALGAGQGLLEMPWAGQKGAWAGESEPLLWPSLPLTALPFCRGRFC